MLSLKKIFSKSKTLSNTNEMPVHIAIIPDGNGRWAQKRGLPRNMGHRRGSDTLQGIVKHCITLGIKHLTVYAFSTENWKRPKNEVDALMDLLREFLSRARQELSGSNVRINVIGEKEMLPENLRKEIIKVEKMTKDNSGLQFNIALNYGGRYEVLTAVKQISQEVKNGKIEVANIDIDMITSKLYTNNLPDPDLIIRTAGEKRISNFLLWQSAYSEFWTSNVLWPDFKNKDLEKAIKDYQNRDRRYGGI